MPSIGTTCATVKAATAMPNPPCARRQIRGGMCKLRCISPKPAAPKAEAKAAPAKAAPAKAAVDTAKQAFVGNLDRTGTAEALEKAFSKYNKPTFKRKGKGRIVTFASAKLATRAISEMHGKVVEGVSYGEKGLRVVVVKAPAAKAEAKAAPAKASGGAQKKSKRKNKKKKAKAKSGEAVNVKEQKGNDEK